MRDDKKKKKEQSETDEGKEEVEVEDKMDANETNSNSIDQDRTSEIKLRSDDGVEYGPEVDIMSDHQNNITQYVSSQTSSDHTYTSSNDVDILISENQEIDITEWDTDASIDASYTPSVSGWSVHLESDYPGSPPLRYFQSPTDIESKLA